MALLLFTAPFSSVSSSSSSTSVPKPHSILRLCNKSIALHPKPYAGYGIRAPLIHNNRTLLIVKASSDVDGVESSAPETPSPPSDGSVESVSVEKLPLESKLQLKLDQQMKMKMAKKIRLRRKRLVRKRRLRKKGRWPPSKLKKNKTV